MGEEPLLLDAPTLQDGEFTLSERGLTLNGVHVDAAGAHRGWLRRYAPSGWGMGIVAGSLDAATHRSFLTLVGSIARKSSCDWLTPIDNMLRAEDRLVQLDVAARLGILAPRTVVTSSAEIAISELGSNFVVKPLSLGYFVTEDGPQAVFTSEMDATTARQLDFGGAPFVAQQMIETERHFRVVTVGDRAWLASLEADGRPLDWRQQERAHRAWQPGDDKCRDRGRRSTSLKRSVSAIPARTGWVSATSASSSISTPADSGSSCRPRPPDPSPVQSLNTSREKVRLRLGKQEGANRVLGTSSLRLGPPFRRRRTSEPEFGNEPGGPHRVRR